jgi:hypothetical protein
MLIFIYSLIKIKNGTIYMSELNPSTIDQEASREDELVLVPVEQSVVGISQNPQEPAYYNKAMTYNVNNGIVQSSEKGRGMVDVALAEPDYIAKLESQGYQRDSSASVDIGNGFHPIESTEVMPRLALDRAARESGAQLREVPFTNHKGEHDTHATANPLDYGDFIDITMDDSAEVNTDGEKIWHKSLLRDQISEDPEQFLLGVGRYNVNNGVIGWTTVEGHKQISVANKEVIKRLEDMGYTQKIDMAVPHSNGEEWNTDSTSHQIMDKNTGNYIGTVPEVWSRLVSPK